MVESIEEFPGEIVQHIALFLDFGDIKCLNCVSSFFNSNLCRDDKFWKQLFKRDVSAFPKSKKFNYKTNYLKTFDLDEKARNEDWEGDILEPFRYAITQSNEKSLERLETEKLLEAPIFKLKLAAEHGKLHIVKYLLSITPKMMRRDVMTHYIYPLRI